MSEQRAVCSVILGAVLWGCISIFVRQLTAAGLTLLQIVLARALFSTLIIVIFLIFTRPYLLRIRLRDLWMFIGSGFISFVLFNWCYFTVICQGGASVAVVLLYTSPIWVMLLAAIIFKEKITRRKLLALVLTFAGCILVAGLLGNVALSPRLLILGLYSGLGYGLYSIFSRLALRRYHPLTLIAYTFICALPPALLLGAPVSLFKLTMAQPQLLLSEIGVSALCTVLPYIFYTRGLEHLDTGRAAIFATAEPLIGAALGVFAYHETLTITKACGMTMILAAVVLLNINKKPQQTQL